MIPIDNDLTLTVSDGYDPTMVFLSPENVIIEQIGEQGGIHSIVLSKEQVFEMLVRLTVWIKDGC